MTRRSGRPPAAGYNPIMAETGPFGGGLPAARGRAITSGMTGIRAADLLVGSDHDFVVNLYLAALGRWPDEEGYTHFRAMAAEGAAGRTRALHIIIGSPEAAQRGTRIAMEDPLVPSDPAKALAAQLSLRTEFLHRQMNAAPAAAPGTTVPEALVRELRAEMAALRAEIRERMAGIAAQAAPAAPPPAVASADAVHDALALAEARMELRIRALEKRLP